MMSEYQLDSVDKSIIHALQQDARTPYTEIAQRIGVSHGLIHQRVERLTALGIIIGMSVDIEPAKVGYPIQTFIGVILEKPAEYKNVLKKLEGCPEVTEAYYSTGNYTFMIKVHCKSVSHLHEFLTGTLQKTALVRSTETILVMDVPIRRHLEVK